MGLSRQTDAVSRHEHVVEFYDGEAFLVDTVRDFLGVALGSDDAAIVVATTAHRKAFGAALCEAGIDVGAAVREGRYLAFDAADLLSHFMVDGHPDATLFHETIGAVLARATLGGRRIRVYGEMVALLWDGGDVGSALALEDLWNDLAGSQRFDLLCAYPMRAFEDEASGAAFRRICRQHTTVIPSEGYSLLSDPAERSRAVARLQQETAALHAAMRRGREQRDMLTDLAYVDSLTGLGNRRAFDLHLAREWTVTQRQQIDSFVVVVDLDGFKSINDSCGHAAGDQVLRQFTESLRVASRSTDIVARIGGDEFGVLLIGCDERAARSFEARLRDVLAEPAWPRQTQITASAGHASLHDATSPAGALDGADLAMLARKHAR